MAFNESVFASHSCRLGGGLSVSNSRKLGTSFGLQWERDICDGLARLIMQGQDELPSLCSSQASRKGGMNSSYCNPSVYRFCSRILRIFVGTVMSILPCEARPLAVLESPACSSHIHSIYFEREGYNPNQYRGSRQPRAYALPELPNSRSKVRSS
ncbi:hypothetical protein VNO77_19307 [Canavalia gladiata]|uniref:Uncharacterized protein n=1 Tax=Canavalia gladiata TaxID=3824 RepID=A0AAN9LMF2_CANGL